MDAERFEIVKRLLATLEALPESEHAAYLDSACGGDEELRSDVEALMHDDDVPGIMRTGGLASRIGPMMTDDRATLGRHIGPYRLVDVLGEGGMGVVYHAEQTTPIRRDVALKLVPFGLDTARVLSRFEAERQSLALMNHPYIAQALEAGAGEDGRPYFVMELVRGEPVTDYCAREKPPLAARLKLFLQICEAIQHAHQRGIIHRDLKPSNVLLTRQGAELVPKIIDFGIAKAIEAQAPSPYLTQTGHVLGTPEYMSPEQAGVIDAGLDTRTDVYSLGVMLYELISGRRPYELKKRTAIELERALRTPPPPPSRMAIEAGARPSHGQAIRDLDAVTLMAIERTPDERYSSVEQLADDVRRVIEHRPVRARPQTRAYRAQKFVRRHAAAVATAALLLAITAVGIAGVVMQRNRAIASEARAVAEAARAKEEGAKASEVARFLTNLFRESDPARARGASVTARELLERGATRLSTDLSSQDALRATLMDTIGVVYRALGMIGEAERITSESLTIRRRALGPEHRDIAASLDNLGQISRERTRYEQSERYHREALAMRRQVLQPGDPDVAQSLSNLALALRERGKYDEAKPLVLEALEIRRAALGPEHSDTLASMNVLGDIEDSSGRRAEAERWYRQVLETRRRVLPPNDPKLAISLNNVAGVTSRTGRLAEAEAMHREALAIRLKIFDPDHADVTTSQLNLAGVLQDQGRLDDAEVLYRTALAADRRKNGNQHMDVAIDLNNLASLLEERGKLTEAGRMYDESLAIRLALQGEKHPSIPNVLNNIGRLQLVQGALADAERSLRRAIELRTALGLEKHPRTGDSMVWLGRVFLARGRLADAEQHYATAVAIHRAASPSGSPGLASALVAQGHVMVRQRHPAEAESLLREALDFRRKNLPAGHRGIGDAEAALADCLLQQSKPDEVEALLASSIKSAPDGPTPLLYDQKAVQSLLSRLKTQTTR
jgi:tetratricopeptide (TPR) repeat protein